MLASAAIRPEWQNPKTQTHLSKEMGPTCPGFLMFAVFFRSEAKRYVNRGGSVGYHEYKHDKWPATEAAARQTN